MTIYTTSSRERGRIPWRPIRAILAPMGRTTRARATPTATGIPTSDPAAAHIFPFATSAKKDFANLNSYLQFFWGDERTMAWRRQYEEADATQSAKNLITMNHPLYPLRCGRQKRVFALHLF